MTSIVRLYMVLHVSDNTIKTPNYSINETAKMDSVMPTTTSYVLMILIVTGREK